MRIALTLVFFTFLPFYTFSQCNDTEVSVQSETGEYGYEMSWEIFDENGIACWFFSRRCKQYAPTTR